MRVAVIDVGSNTARLLVAARDTAPVAPVYEERALLALGDEIERFGQISDLKLAETGDRVRRYAMKARELGCSTTSVIVTAPGRQASNSTALLGVLERAAGVPPQLLSSEEEGRLAFEGAVAETDASPGAVAVCDVGGGSTEIVVGDRRRAPEFCRSLELGSLRLTRRFLDVDPPSKRAVRRARADVERQLEAVDAPPAEAALATGGSARSLRKVTRRRILDQEAFADALGTASKRTSMQLAQEFGLDPFRAGTLLAGTLILAETQRRLGLPLQVARGGLREGAAIALLSQLAAA
jgi:exopolyphosphatase / guanosine-5'-triphosphate,3'-diphosphate pyrophosphatase